jgi:valyl-tRNA synthetase
METGYDILFFWVARMIMMGLEFTGKAPFHTVYLHGLIRDENGKKMSKTYGNVIDPLEVMDELGTDALRFTLLVGSTPGNDMNLSIKRVEANRNFANKVWNATRLVTGSLDQAPKKPQGDPQWTLADSWIRARLQELIRDVERLFGNYQYGEAGRQIYDFFWSDFADWYLEVAKLQLADGADHAYYTAATLASVLDTSLRLLHPFTPFVTEELWGHLKRACQAHSPELAPQGGWEAALIVARWPEPRPEEGWEKDKMAAFSLVKEVVRAIRNLRAEKSIGPGRRIPAILVSRDHARILEEQAGTIAALAQLDQAGLAILKRLDEKPEDHIGLVAGPVDIYLPLAGMVDVAEERARLERNLQEAVSQVGRLEELLSGPFSEKAPAAVVQKEREKLESYRETAQKLRAQLEGLGGIHEGH